MTLTPALVRELEEMPSQLQQLIDSFPAEALGWDQQHLACLHWLHGRRASEVAAR